MYFDDARGLRSASLELDILPDPAVMLEVCSLLMCRKKNKKWRQLQAYLPYLGWGLLSLVAICLAFREHRLGKVGQSLRTATQELNVLKTQQAQLQVCLQFQNWFQSKLCRLSICSSTEFGYNVQNVSTDIFGD